MRMILRAMLLTLLLAGAAAAAPLPLASGVNLHEWLNWSPLAEDGSYRWPPYRSVAEWQAGGRPASDWPATDPFADLRALGFDYVRLTVDPGPLLASAGARRAEALAVLAEAVDRLLAADLKVVFNLHSVSQVPQNGPDVINAPAGSPQVAGYIAMVAEVAQMLTPLGTDRVAIEPYNEPAHYPCDASGSEDWQEIMAATVAAIRAVSADITIVATGACGGSVTGLTDIRPDFDDPDILYSFHMYEPHSFTHQRADSEGDFASGLPWPASAGSAELTVEMLKAHMLAAGLNEAEQARNLAAVGRAIETYFAEDWGEAQLTARIGEAVAWARANGIPPTRLFMGEFGAILMSADGRMGAFNADRLRYLSAARQAAEANGIAWAIWEYANPYGMSVLAPSGPAVPDREMLRALGL
ncbi:glycoside hydrolase family 5 protein [Devosia sp. A16]|uniref:glycoside hydrolase family 5 protein n=1 Tax=Devosia sp. A16 TaxID=1736675 RepID=UPI0006D856CD|nr:cellulase family glycosylhydrolase [Devosia sp. A16]